MQVIKHFTIFCTDMQQVWSDTCYDGDSLPVSGYKDSLAEFLLFKQGIPKKSIPESHF